MGPWDAEERRQKPPKVLPLASREGSDQVISGAVIDAQFQSTLPAGEATLSEMIRQSPVPFQSTLLSREATSVGISTSTIALFQSTLPAGEATYHKVSMALRSCHFNPRFPRGKRRYHSVQQFRHGNISIHASRGGSDLMNKTGKTA